MLPPPGDEQHNGVTIVADCTADDTAHVLLRAAERGFRVASANKKPFADAPFEVFERLTRWHGTSRFESTAGACTPMVAAAMRLRACSDHVHAFKVQLQLYLPLCAHAPSPDPLPAPPQTKSFFCAGARPRAAVAAATPLAGLTRAARRGQGAMSGTLGFLLSALQPPAGPRPPLSEALAAAVKGTFRAAAPPSRIRRGAVCVLCARGCAACGGVRCVTAASPPPSY